MRLGKRVVMRRKCVGSGRERRCTRLTKSNRLNSFWPWDEWTHNEIRRETCRLLWAQKIQLSVYVWRKNECRQRVLSDESTVNCVLLCARFEFKLDNPYRARLRPVGIDVTHPGRKRRITVFGGARKVFDGTLATPVPRSTFSRSGRRRLSSVVASSGRAIWAYIQRYRPGV